MNSNVYVYIIDMPIKVHEVVAPCSNGDYTIYINARLSRCGQLKAYNHAMWHIEHNDFEKHDVGEIERDAHEGVK
jgi:hypothetical protein